MTHSIHRAFSSQRRGARLRHGIPGVLAPFAAACFLALAGCDTGENVSSIADTRVEDEAKSDTAPTETERFNPVSPEYYGAEPEVAEPAQPPADATALAEVQPVGDADLEGEVRFEQQDDGVRITGELTGLEPGEHGLHLHENSSCAGEDAAAAGGHFSPDDDPHGSPQDMVEEHHAGDLGNIVADRDGTATIDLSDAEISLAGGPYSIIGKTIVVHAGRDDLNTQPSGASGTPVGCGEIRGERLAQS